MADDVRPKGRRGPRPSVIHGWSIVYEHNGKPVIALDTICYSQRDAQQRLAAWRVLHQRGSLAAARISRITLTVALAEGEALDGSPAVPTVAPS